MKALTRILWLTLVALTLSLMGCKSLLKKRVPVTAPSDSAPVAVVPPPAPPAPAVAAVNAPAASAVADDDGVPAPEDFEDEAFEKVTTANFKAEFSRLQKEIASK